ncbi:MAG: hypothetical protein QOF44_2351, partial [Streptomyces sp.]|nr:hypothetical protein [Streptomyces sp.]
MAVNAIASPSPHARRRRTRLKVFLALLPGSLLLAAVSPISGIAYAAQAPVGLGTATNYAVLAGSTITNTGNSVINGDLGLAPGSAVTGFPPGIVNGAQHIGDGPALQAQLDLTAAYGDAAGRLPETVVPAELGTTTKIPGVYRGSSPLEITGTLTLDAQGDPDAVFIFKTPSTLITASNSVVSLINGASA